MLLGKIVRAIQKGNVDLFLVDTVNTPAWVLRDLAVKLSTAEEVMKEYTEKFLLDTEGVSFKEVDASARAMSEQGLFHLPYPSCYTECKFQFEAAPSGESIQGTLCILVMEYSGQNTLNEYFTDIAFQSLVFVNLPRYDGKHGFRWIPGRFNIGAYYCQCKLYEDVKFLENSTGQPWNQLAAAVADTVKTLIVLLQTKGVEKEFVATGKTELIHRNQPVDGYTIVRNYKSRDSSGRQIEERKRVRLHLRRGHVRTQHWGRNNKYTKQIWIEPTLVGYEEEGKIEHLYEVDKA